jgi:hypothetical protein
MLLLKSILANRWFRAAAAAAFFQQLLVAGGTFLLGDITTRLPTEGIPWHSCFVMLGCMALAGSIAFYVMNLFSLRAQHSTLQDFFDLYFENTFLKPLFWRSSEERTKRHDMMCREAQEAIQEGNAFLLDVWTTGWNIVLNTISVVLVIGPESGAVILAAGLVSSCLVHFASERIAQNAIVEMDDRNQLNAHLNCSWDNIVLGNTLSFTLWNKRFQEHLLKANGSAVRSFKSRERILATGNFMTSAAVVGSMLFQAWLNKNNLAAVLALFAMLPRTMQINMHVQIIQSYWAGWQRLRERLTLASECLSTFPESRGLGLISPAAIHIAGRSLVSKNPDSTVEAAEKDTGSVNNFKVDDLFQQVENLKSGRLTVRGENGSGKSVLLSLIKERLAQRAFYLPAHHQLELPGVALSQSHGERAIAALEAVSQGENDVQVLLLDEWDANLSPEKRTQLTTKIETLAQNKLVIEVRHNQDPQTRDQHHA